MKQLYLFLWGLLLAFCSCSREPIVDVSIATDSTRITQEEALKTLGRFLADTRVADQRTIQSVDTHYSTKNSGVREADAYIVNYTNNEGFAVLGANTYVDEIVAITESGHIDASTLDVSFSDQDDSVSLKHAAFVKQIIEFGLANGKQMGLRGEGDIDWEEDDSNPGGENGGGSSGGGGGSSFVTRDPMLTYSWGQSSPYNWYCFRTTIGGNYVNAYTGCSTTAMAMIVTYNEFPQTVSVNNNTLNWTLMKSEYVAGNLDSTGKNHVALLMGSIYNFVNKIATEDYTMITPQQIKNRMEDFGYTNVVKHSDSDFTIDMVSAVSQMLRHYKPVFISAIPGTTFSAAHSWVIDGAKYISGSYLLHFNFGWHGYCNGYFSRSCLNPAHGIEYDNGYTYNEDDDYTYSWHFRVITYDIPVGNYTLQISY